MFQKDTKEAHFAAVPLFSGLDRKQMSSLMRHVDEQSVEAGKVIIKQGSTAFEMCVVLDGSVTIERDGIVLEVAGPGASFGELSMLDKSPRTATVTARTDVRLGIIGPREFDTALETVPGLSKAIMVRMARRLRAMDEMIVPVSK